MQSSHINPFLQSATMVLEQMCAIRPSRGELALKQLQFYKESVWLKISVTGNLQGDILFGFEQSVALKIVSGMMGGFEVTELDEMGQSALSELGNMISGNASILLYNEGITIDISPPSIIRDEDSQHLSTTKVLTIPLQLEGIGQFDMCVALL
jgi:chemotaxis protein CheX